MDQTLRVDVVDMKGEGMNQVVLAVRTNNKMGTNPTVLVEYVPQGDRYESFVVQVAQSVSMMQRSISVLRLWAHAYVTLGSHVPTGGAILGAEAFTVEDVRSQRAAFARLTPYFSRHPATRFEFRGCGVANNKGLDLMRELARLWGIPVHAAKQNQGTGMFWDGPVMEIRPDGVERLIGGVPFNSAF